MQSWGGFFHALRCPDTVPRLLWMEGSQDVCQRAEEEAVGPNLFRGIHITILNTKRFFVNVKDEAIEARCGRDDQECPNGQSCPLQSSWEYRPALWKIGDLVHCSGLLDVGFGLHARFDLELPPMIVLAKSAKCRLSISDHFVSRFVFTVTWVALIDRQSNQGPLLNNRMQ